MSEGQGSGNRTKRPTLKDVAQLAGVGTMTASRVVTGVGYVSSETRTKVEAAISQLAYIPNHQARSLRSSRSGTIALIVSDITNPYFTTLARGVEDAARPSGSLLLLGSSDESEEEELRYMNLLVQKGVDGVILVPSHLGTSAIALAQSRGIPVAAVDRRGPEGIDCVRCDSEKAAQELAQLLLDKGHRSAGILGGTEGITTFEDRIRGFTRAFEKGGGKCQLTRGEMEVESGQEAARMFMLSNQAPTCFFSVNNFLAIGALKEIQELGMAVPQDISVVGFDDLPSSMLAFPFLTVAAQPAYDLGYRAASLLLERIEQPDLPPRHEILGTQIIQRSSVGSPRPTAPGS
jgi:LacI family transcriptional regulator